jgi:hypothetical protein
LDLEMGCRGYFSVLGLVPCHDLTITITRFVINLM